MFLMKKKILYLICAVLLILCIAGCGKKDVSQEDSVDILLVTDFGTINDGSYNQGAWEGIQDYAAANNLVAKYYQPSGTEQEDYIEQIKLGAKNGAKVIVCPGSLFEEAVFKVQKQLSDVCFIVLDGVPHNEDYSDETIRENILPILFSEEEAGFLAGYSAVREGYTNLAFMGGVPEDPVIRYGYGFVQGADYASIQMGIPVYIRYTYCNTYFEDTSVEATASSWYDNGTEVIFACGGAMGKSVMRAAENHNGKVIGVDVDQSAESDTVITSALKRLDMAVYQSLESYYNGTFKGGEVVKLTAKENGVGLPMATSKFTNFQVSEYEEIYNQLVDGYIVPYAQTNVGTCEELSLVNTEVTYIVP